MQSPASLVVVLGTGGTIAGQAADASDNVGYKAGQIGVAQLLAAVPALAEAPLECEQLAQLDSKDMDYATWQRLAHRVAYQLTRDEVVGVVVTHGTDTMEETAYFLHRVLAPTKPVVLTGAMRPATSLQPDGPQNLLDAVALARMPNARGVLLAFAGAVFDPVGVRKRHSYALDAFGAGDAGPLAHLRESCLQRYREWPAGVALGLPRIERDAHRWPRVEIVINHAGADGRIVRDLLAQGVDGIVVAGTGNGTISVTLQQALAEAAQRGVRVLRTTRCAEGEVIGGADASALTPVQARIELLLELLGG